MKIRGKGGRRYILMSNVKEEAKWKQCRDDEVRALKRGTCPQGGKFPGSPVCSRQHGVFILVTSCTYEPWVSGVSAQKAPLWSPWRNNDCTASLLSATQALHAVVSAFLKQKLHHRCRFLDFYGAVWLAKELSFWSGAMVKVVPVFMMPSLALFR